VGATGLTTKRYRDLAGRLRQWREAAGFTQRELAAQLGRPPSYVAKCEQAERRVDVLEFVDWCRATGREPKKCVGDL